MIGVSQMFLLLQPKLLSNSPGVYPSPGHYLPLKEETSARKMNMPKW